jgi:3-hydroxy-3-methylglutaryl CoA synthase
MNIYGCSLYVSMEELMEARGYDSRAFMDAYMVRNRALNPLYEDAVTMAANAVQPLLTDRIREQIGLLIFGTETANDLSRPASTHIIEACGLPNNIRNFEVKHACYSGTAALGCALDWIRSGSHRGKKALILASDYSRTHLHKPAEPILGGCAAAVLVSETPRIIEYEALKTGIWSGGFYDTFRPDARLELFNTELSLFSYLEALQESYREYATNVEYEIDLFTHFNYLVYHMPFPGMAFRAHRSLCNSILPGKPDEILKSFHDKVKPSLSFASQVGSVYGASNFIGLCGLLHHEQGRIRGGERIGFFSYGSGAIGQFYSGVVLPDAAVTVATMRTCEALRARQKATLEEYEAIETTRDQVVGAADYEPPLDFPAGLFENHYLGKRRLFLRRIEQNRRVYEWS